MTSPPAAPAPTPPPDRSPHQPPAGRPAPGSPPPGSGTPPQQADTPAKRALDSGAKPDAAFTPEERQLQIKSLRRRGQWSALARRSATVLLITAALAAGLIWGVAQRWWPPSLFARLPQPVSIVQWLRSPDLADLPGLPPAWNPWAPLTLVEPETLLTRWKIGQLANDPAACQAWLSAAPSTDLTPVPDHADTSTLLCGWKTASRISRLDGIGFSSPFTLACGAAVALARWERHALQPAATQYLGSKVVRMEHLGSYACRSIGSGAEGSLSTHANANALDIAGFTLANGRRVSVRQNWRSANGDSAEQRQSAGAAVDALRRSKTAPDAAEGHAEARFLRAARDGACDSFNAVLGPDYNAAHSDHFHLDRGPHRVCR